MFKKKQHRPDTVLALPAEVGRFGRLSEQELVAAIEASIGGAAEVFRGLSHREIDNGWVASELESHLVSALGAVRALRERVDLQQSLK